MSTVKEQITGNVGQSPAEALEAQVRSVLEHAVEAQRQGLRVYESLQNLNEVIRTEYGSRVLHELIQNAHDAHEPGDRGRIAIKLVVQSESKGVLYIANGGRGFRREDVEAIKNLATSAKEVGKDIGNKGLGFRSIEALTDDVQIYSRGSARQTDRFDGYCFRFAEAEEIEKILRSYCNVDAATSRKVAGTVPRYLVPRPLEQQRDEVASYAHRGYATVIVAPLHTAEAVELAKSQVRALADLDVPLLLFLDRIAEIRIDVEIPNQQSYRRRLRRRQTVIDIVPTLAGYRMYEVRVGEDKRFLVVRREVDKERLQRAVERSIHRVPQLKRWLNWKGQPVVSVAVGLSPDAVTKGRLYNFLPMGEEATSPLLGYLDAPFFADINRRNADLELPLNKTLMEAAAEACAAATLSIVKHDLSVLQHAVFDLIAWTGEHAEKLDDALVEAGSSLHDAPVIPAIAIEGRRGWACLSEINIWPEGTFSILKARAVAKQVGARLVSSSELDSTRLVRLKEVAKRIGLWSLSPSGPELAEWSEAFARSLLDRKATPRIWSQFYEDLSRIFHATAENLEELSGKSILYDRLGKLRQSGGHDGTTRTGVFVRSEAAKGKRTKAGVPFPPPNLARRYHFLDKSITFRPETLVAFVEADLIREYDPVEALAGLKSALGANPNDNRRQEALSWAFQVWRIERGRIGEELRNADLRVPTRTGWQPATHAAFSASWTRVGQTLENFLVEAAKVSRDCQQALHRLLIGFENWPTIQGASKRDWMPFLEFIGVTDGLRPVVACMPSSSSPAYWNRLLHSGKETEGLDGDWCAEVVHVNLNHPHTDYRRSNEARRLPGQIEHEELPEASKEAFCALAFEHLKAHGAKFFAFEIGRFERHYRRDWDRRELPTPLATFLRSKAWIATDTQEEVSFRRVNECWAARTKRGGPPRFVDRMSSTIVDFSDDKDLVELAFSEKLGLRDWQSQDTAVDRLKDLATVSMVLASHDRPAFRREYQRAWWDVVQAGIPLPTELSLTVNRRGRLEELNGDPEAPPNVIVTENAQQFEARVLSSAGQAVLEVGGDTSTDKVADLLDESGTFRPCRLDGAGVRLLVDDESFVPSASDPPLTSLGLSWLPEVTVLGHELLGEQLEQGIQSATVDKRVRAIRVRCCKAITLVINEKEVSLTETMARYAFEHEALPTLILTDVLSLDWTTLARGLSGPISRLIDSRLRSLEPLLLRLALDQVSGALDVPSDETLAKALECDVQTVQEHRAALRTDLGHLLHLLMPVVAYFKGPELARQLESEADRAGTTFDVAGWLRTQLADAAFAPEALINACERASDRAALRRELKLDYERFNRALVKTGELPLSNEAELRRLYEAYRDQMRPTLIDRLRRHHAADFRKGSDLSTYVERKRLTFLPLDPAWILTRETLESEAVEAHVSRLLDETLGKDRVINLPALDQLLESNRKSVREFASDAAPVVEAWCRRNQGAVPEPWRDGGPHSVVQSLENAGLLDFELVSIEQVSVLCRRAVCWPLGMPATLDRTALGLKQTEVEKEEKRRKQERQQKEIERRSIHFAGRSLDTGDPSFAHTLQQVAKDCIARDDAWFERSRQRTRLVEFATAAQSRDGGGHQDGRTGGARGRPRQLPEAQRQAMGMASEWLAFEFLRRRHDGFVDETCWVSENRAHFFGGDKGDDGAGYDFRVTTPQATWLYEVKSSLEDAGEFELTANELRVASRASKDGQRRYRILYVPFVFSPERWCVLELPNPMGEATRTRFKEIGRGSVRFRFERRQSGE